MIKTYRDMYGYLITGFDAHVFAWRYHQKRKFDERREAWSALAKRG